MKQIKKICVFSELLFCIGANAQQKITSLSPIPDATKQTIEQYISTHSIEEMNKDTVVLSNVYSLIGYDYEDKYLGELTGSFIVVGQDYQYKDLKLQSNEKLLYVLTENGYEQTPVDKEIIKKKKKKKALETFNALIEEARKNNVNMTMDEINEEIRLARSERKQREKEKEERKQYPAFLMRITDIYTKTKNVSLAHY